MGYFVTDILNILLNIYRFYAIRTIKKMTHINPTHLCLHTFYIFLTLMLIDSEFDHKLILNQVKFHFYLLFYLTLLCCYFFYQS
jgi:hypothetical protein